MWDVRSEAGIVGNSHSELILNHWIMSIFYNGGGFNVMIVCFIIYHSDLPKPKGPSIQDQQATSAASARFCSVCVCHICRPALPDLSDKSFGVQICGCSDCLSWSCYVLGSGCGHGIATLALAQATRHLVNRSVGRSGFSWCFLNSSIMESWIHGWVFMILIRGFWFWLWSMIIWLYDYYVIIVIIVFLFSSFGVAVK